MQHGGHRMTAQRRLHLRGVPHISFDQCGVPDGGGVARREVVEHHDRVVGRPQRLHGVTADVAGPSGDQHRAHVIVRSSSR